jgi:hypothetical protein
MNKELYINYKKVDMDGKTQITLKYQSNILGDLSKIQSNFSYTVKLPKTLRNRNVLDCPDMPSYAGSNILRKYNHARYLRNEIELFTGKAVLLSSSDTYEIALMWSELSNLNEFLKQEKNLNDLPDYYLEDETDTPPEDITKADRSLVPWNQHVMYNEYDQNYFGYAKYNRGSDVNYYSNSLPYVTARNLLNRISQIAGLTFQYQFDTAVLNKLAVPCQSLKWGEWAAKNVPLFINNFEFFEPKTAPNSNEVTYKFRAIIDFYQFYFNVTVNENATQYTQNFYSKYNISFKIKWKIYLTTDDMADLENYELLITAGSISRKYNLDYGVSGGYNNNCYVTGEGETEIFNLAANKSVSLNLLKNGDTRTFEYNDSYFKIIVTDDTNYNEINYEEQLKYPSKFPVYHNLPKIKITDFIKTIQNLFGVFTIKGSSVNEIKFISIGTLYENKVEAKDWSGKFLTKNGYTLTYDFNSMSQVNVLQYKEDEQRQRAAGSLIVENETLPYSQELVTLPFATSDKEYSGAAMVKLPQFTDVGLPNMVEFNELKEPRILLVYNEQNQYKLKFQGLEYSALLQSVEYQRYQEMILKPIVLKCTFKLSEFDLKDLDFTIPIYLKQFGKYYGIIDLTDSGDKVTANLIQL